MPVYDYKCKTHGLFHDLTALSDHDKPKACPQCSTLSPRVLVVAPEILAMSPNKRAAMEVNEVASHEPMHLNREASLEHAHDGCGHHHHSHKKIIHSGYDQSKISDLRQQVLFTAEGNKIFPSQRPWMISH